MLKIGLTGGIGSGKSTAAKFFADLGVKVFDADDIVHELLKQEALKKKLVAYFGEAILDKNKQIDRTNLRQIVLGDEKKRKWLEKLIHPLVYQEMERAYQAINSPYCIFVIPLLIESPPKNNFLDRVLLIDSPVDLQIKRVLSRSNYAKEEVRKMLAAQTTKEQRLAKADDIIVNTESLDALKTAVHKMHLKYLQLQC